LVLICCLFSLQYSAEEIRVSLFNSKNIQSIDFKAGSEVYFANSNTISFQKNSWKRIKLHAGNIYIQGTNFGKKVKISSKNWRRNFSLRASHLNIVESIFEGDLEILVRNGELVVVNLIDIERYLSGVVESESGKEQNLEFYKTQAIIARTWTLSNMEKHAGEGFHLCNEVHCQAYKGMSRFNPEIPLAVEETESVVIVDSEINLIHATYHSNCGGKTVNSEDVWSKKVSYLRSVRDTFCLESNHSNWEKTISNSKWRKLLAEKYGLNENETDSLMDYHPKERVSEIFVADTSLLTKKIRKDLQLKSTYFKIDSNERETQFIGRGFGHGVGLCQEGAMEMSKKGYTSFEILHFYYSNIHLVHRSYIAFFKEN